MNRRELPLLGAVAGFLQWCEELRIIVSGPLRTVGLGSALVDLLTGGALLAAQPGLLYAWAISQAAGVDAQLVASAAKLAAAFHARRYWLAAGYGGLLVPLAYVGFLASNVFATQQSQGLTTAEALARLGTAGHGWHELDCAALRIGRRPGGALWPLALPSARRRGERRG